MSDNSNNNTSEVSPAIIQMVEDGLRLISYIAKSGNTKLPQELAKAMVDAKFKIANGQWGKEDETEFLLNYDQLSTIVYPVTVESIHAITPTQTQSGKKTTEAEHAVTRYRRLALFSLLCMLTAHLYFIIGNNLRVNLTEVFKEREAIHADLNKMAASGIQDKTLTDRLSTVNQELDGNYQLLKLWNKLSAFGYSFKEELPRYTEERLKAELGLSTQDIDATNNANEIPTNSQLTIERYKARIKYHKNILAADFFLGAFQSYILPLLYGLLGAFIYVLRSLHRDIQILTYTHHSEIKYRLRLTLGALGGMVIGWFLKPQAVDVTASLSPMALAFLMGYNVDVLFAIMDKAIDNIRAMIDKQPQSVDQQPNQNQAEQPSSKAT